MNRIIEFRGFSSKINKWVFGDLLQGVGTKEGKVFILPRVSNLAYLNGCHPLDGYDVVPESVGQFTGLLDAIGHQIFEGDILRPSKPFEDEVYRIEWDMREAHFVAAIYDYSQSTNEGGGEVYSSDKERIDECPISDITSLEISGNSYQNPTLLT